MKTSSAIPSHLWSYSDRVKSATEVLSGTANPLAAAWDTFFARCGSYAGDLLDVHIQRGTSAYRSRLIQANRPGGPVVDAVAEILSYCSSCEATDEYVRDVGNGFADSDRPIRSGQDSPSSPSTFDHLMTLDDAVLTSRMQGVVTDLISEVRSGDLANSDPGQI